ncbi:MAG: choice-of-anchor T family protein [Candidatus Poseidoniales archaeon]|jgi:hypothetical protein
MGKRIIFVMLVLLVSNVPLIDSASAQLPAVDLECQAVDPSGNVEIHVYPGATNTGQIDCTVSNPNVYQEKIRITVASSELLSSAPGEFYVGPNSEVDFQVSIQADAQMSKRTVEIQITAEVVEASGLPPPNPSSSESNLLAHVMQFSGFLVEQIEPIIYIESGSDFIIEYRIINTGNYRDKFLFEYLYDSRVKLEDAGFQISMPTSSVELDLGQQLTFRTIVRAPSYGNDWPINSKGVREMTFTAEISVVSDFSCKYERTGCNTVSVIQTITVYEEASESEKIISGTSEDQSLIYAGSGGAILLLLILFVFMKKRK